MHSVRSGEVMQPGFAVAFVCDLLKRTWTIVMLNRGVSDSGSAQVELGRRLVEEGGREVD